MGLFSKRTSGYVNETPNADYNNALTRRFTGPALKGEYIWRVTYRVKGDGKKGFERPNMIRVLATNQSQAEAAVRAYMLLVYNREVTVDSAYNAGQAAEISHWWYRDSMRNQNG
jgi:hypothetical protein